VRRDRGEGVLELALRESPLLAKTMTSIGTGLPTYSVQSVVSLSELGVSRPKEYQGQSCYNHIVRYVTMRSMQRHSPIFKFFRVARFCRPGGVEAIDSCSQFFLGLGGHFNPSALCTISKLL
jgi:hypothetical protein